MQSAYPIDFYEAQVAGSISSARVIVPLVLSMFPSRSVVDVGCGVGAWLAEFARNGVQDYLGIDGSHVTRDMLKIPPEHFRVEDLTEFSDIDARFDLACSVEVAEHLPEDRAHAFVSMLVKAAPVVPFSAAIPGQGGTHHVNEQWQSYWAELFRQFEYVPVDCIRPTIFYDNRVEWWYRQNILIFCEPNRIPHGFSAETSDYVLNRIHPNFIVRPVRGGREGLKMLGEGIAAIVRSVTRKLSR